MMQLLYRQNLKIRKQLQAQNTPFKKNTIFMKSVSEIFSVIKGDGNPICKADLWYQIF